MKKISKNRLFELSLFGYIFGIIMIGIGLSPFLSENYNVMVVFTEIFPLHHDVYLFVMIPLGIISLGIILLGVGEKLRKNSLQ